MGLLAMGKAQGQERQRHMDQTAHATEWRIRQFDQSGNLDQF